MRRESYRVRVQYQYRQLELGLYPTLTVAKAALEKARLEIIHGTFIPPAERRRMYKDRLEAERVAGVTVAEWFETWIGELESDKLRPRSPATLVSYRSTITVWVLPAIGQKRLLDVTEADLSAIVDSAAHKGVGAAQNVVRHTRAMLNRAVEVGAGGLTKAPKMPRLPRAGTRQRTDDEIPTLEELLAIIEVMPANLRILPELGFWGQLRVGELLGLRRRDFRHLDLPGKAELSVQRQWNVKGASFSAPKVDSVGDLALPDEFVPALRDHLERYVDAAPDALLFPSGTDAERPLSYNKLHGTWRAATVGMRYPFSLHSLRHLGLTEYNRQGATPPEVQRRGRHHGASASASARYQHASRERDRALIDKLGADVERRRGEWRRREGER